MKNVMIDQIIIGEGKPKIIVPLVDRTESALLASAEHIQQLDCDIVEWRIDFFQDVEQTKIVADLSHKLRKVLNKPLLITFRTYKEGGELSLSDEKYFEIYDTLIEHGRLDLIDLELFMPEERVTQTLEAAQKKGIKVIMCNHDFDKTPPKEEILSRLQQMQKKGADICKIAVMPQNSEDVLTLLEATREMYENYSDQPLITMSMGALGMISRISGQVFGSAATFGSAGTASAPGQISVTELRKIIDTLQV
ncbi:type I 3-dehydroquinate dehydratase [Enterococcus sp.]|uniref:type I 3-dehydroquinate dehydratase n=1 Tax=Enterococcus sp. TaxID=35783 RepID=UPI002907AB9D|nr:type I 3-dehydroquinate dehydratase [Enterococcus sp.]MDU5334086.1 type I 3-dehydroquinate dehydratase [Enterococcus sp.]